jgi:hypothetical protein
MDRKNWSRTGNRTDPIPRPVLIQYRDPYRYRYRDPYRYRYHPYWSDTETVLIDTETRTDAEFSVMNKRFCFQVLGPMKKISFILIRYYYVIPIISCSLLLYEFAKSCKLSISIIVWIVLLNLSMHHENLSCEYPYKRSRYS